MSELVKSTWAKINLNIVSILWVGFVSVQALLGTFIAETYHTDFFSFSFHDKLMTLIICFYMWCGSMVALMTNLGKRMKKNESIFDADLDSPLPTGQVQNQQPKDNKP